MIHYYTGNIFDVKAECLVNPVNTMGVMGAGLAREVSRMYPEIMPEYRSRCKKDQLRVGSLFLHKAHDRKILCFPTKIRWQDPSCLDYIRIGLEAFVRAHQTLNIKSYVFPALGCGLGGLWYNGEVAPLMIKYLERLDLDIYIPQPMPEQGD